MTVDVIEAGICDAQNFPSLTQSPGGISEIGISSVDNSIFLKNIPYSEMYSELLKRKHYNFKMIDGKDYLAYSLDTHVVYYMFSTAETVGNLGYGYSYFAPYISENGNFCRYINDEIVEITETDADNN